jgi:hypothetical protein
MARWTRFPGSDIRSVATQTSMTTVEDLMEAVFCVGSAPRRYSEDPRQFSWSVVSWKSVSEEKTRRLMWNGRQPGTQPVDSWELAVQLSSERETEKRWRYSWVDSWQEFWMGGCDKSTWGRETEESLLLEAVAREKLLERQQVGKSLACSD